MPAEAARNVLLRDVQPADVPAMAALYAQHVLHGLGSFEESPPGVDELRARCAAVLENDLPWLVATADGAVVGYGYAAPYRARAAYRHTLEDSVYVAAGLERRGVGTLLLGELIQRCEAGPWRQMVAVIGDSANAGSIALHRRLGFRDVGTLVSVGFKFGRWVDTVLMQRSLGDGDTTLPRQAPSSRAGATR